MKFVMIAFVALAGFAAHADDTKADMNKAASDVKVDAKKGARAASDATCPMVNGKVDCAAKKAKHKVQNAADEVTK